jgi:hypothetical protein
MNRLVNTPFRVLLYTPTLVVPDTELAIVAIMAKELLDRRPADGHGIRRSLLELHDALLHLHKVLLDSERSEHLHCKRF